MEKFILETLKKYPKKKGVKIKFKETYLYKYLNTL